MPFAGTAMRMTPERGKKGRGVYETAQQGARPFFEKLSYFAGRAAFCGGAPDSVARHGETTAAGYPSLGRVVKGAVAAQPLHIPASATKKRIRAFEVMEKTHGRAPVDFGY